MHVFPGAQVLGLNNRTIISLFSDSPVTSEGEVVQGGRVKQHWCWLQLKKMKKRYVYVSECMCDQNNLHEVISSLVITGYPPLNMKCSLGMTRSYGCDNRCSEDYLYM
jgi:hypothetical protein